MDLALDGYLHSSSDSGTITNRDQAEIDRHPTPARLQTISEWAFNRYQTMEIIRAEVGNLARGQGSSPQSPQGWTRATPQHPGAIGASSWQPQPDYLTGSP
jgi:hypothetical protein